MVRLVSLDYGDHPLIAEVPDAARVLLPPARLPQAGVQGVVARALADPIDSPRLSALCSTAETITLVISDPTRDEPRAALIEACLQRAPRARWTLAIATGSHGPCERRALKIEHLIGRFDLVVNHDGHDDRDLVVLGQTKRGTPVRVHRCTLDADLVIATGAIRPHYFAGYGGGCKALFPGLAGNREIRLNHRLKSASGSIAGSVENNPCRADLEEAAAMIPTPVFLINTVHGASGEIIDAVAGNLFSAFRHGAAICEKACTVRTAPAECIVVSAGLPISDSLYQASKLVAAVAPLCKQGVRIVLAAECKGGVGPLDTVNKGIYDIGIRPRLPERHEVVLVSSLPRVVVEQTYCSFSASIDEALSGYAAPLIIPSASGLILHAS